jgi:hypothetical protein
MQARKLEFYVHDISIVEDNFKTAIEARHDCKLVGQRCIETT